MERVRTRCWIVFFAYYRWDNGYSSINTTHSGTTTSYFTAKYSENIFGIAIHGLHRIVSNHKIVYEQDLSPSKPYKRQMYRTNIDMILVRINIAKTVACSEACSKEFKTTVIVSLGILMILRIIFRNGLRKIQSNSQDTQLSKSSPNFGNSSPKVVLRKKCPDEKLL